SMALGSYVYVANHIIHDIVYGRDWLDDVVAQIEGIDNTYVQIFGLTFRTVLWSLRQVLVGCYQVINLVNVALARQMEFNADLVAVRAVGSDAIVHALVRTGFADGALRRTLTDLAHAVDHKVYTRDLFFHQLRTMDFLRRVHSDPHEGEPPALPDDPS